MYFFPISRLYITSFNLLKINTLDSTQKYTHNTVMRASNHYTTHNDTTLALSLSLTAKAKTTHAKLSLPKAQKRRIKKNQRPRQERIISVKARHQQNGTFVIPVYIFFWVFHPRLPNMVFWASQRNKNASERGEKSIFPFAAAVSAANAKRFENVEWDFYAHILCCVFLTSCVIIIFV